MFWSSLIKDLRAWSTRCWHALRTGAWIPGVVAQRGALYGATTIILVLGAYAGAQALRTGFGWLVDALLGVIITGLGTVLIAGPVWLVVTLLRAFLQAYPRFLVAGLSGLIFMGSVVLFLPDSAGALLAAGLAVSWAILGGTLFVIRDPSFADASTLKRNTLYTLSLVMLAANVAFFVWVFEDGSRDHLVEIPSDHVQTAAPLDLANPAEQGPYTVGMLPYGSGTDRHRPAFGEAATLLTDSVDASAFVDELDGWFDWFREWYWGFDRTAFPLNGRVWYPEGDGPFPLVLIVHGNHNMGEFSDPGYAYLGELFASRGTITVSVDQNFLNGSWSANYDEENDARGWLLLEHLRLWHTWNRTTDNPFFAKVDTTHLGLIGHSRGGEAVAIATAFNQLAHYPDDATVPFDYNYPIEAVIAIAPVDGQYWAADQPTALVNVNYLVLHGAHDADVSSFSGDRQYRRVAFTDSTYHFKTSLYLYEANHGQFNTVWGNRDWGLPGGWWLNTAALLPGEAQRQAGSVYMSAFLEATLHQNRAYVPLFQDHRAGASWLPQTHYISRFEDTTFEPLADYEEDVDVRTTTRRGGHITGEHLAVWREQDLGRRHSGRRHNQVVVLGWHAHTDSTNGERQSSASAPAPDTTARYSLSWPPDTFPSLTEEAVLTFAMATSPEKVPEPETDDSDAEDQEDATSPEPPPTEENMAPDKTTEEEAEDKPTQPLDVTLILVDEMGEEAALRLGQFATLLPPLDAQFTRWSLLESDYNKPSEPVLQTFRLPLHAFLSENSQLNLARLQTLHFRFDQKPEGVVFLDEIGFAH